MADLTIIMPSWNKEKYIAEALDSILAQKTTYSYHIVVADDHSTDRTLEIVREYSARHPGVFTVLESDVNQKLFRNVRRAYALCKTPYFCVLDPDDFWTDDHKIQKALDYLNAHPDFTIYATDTWVQQPDGARSKFLNHAEVRDSDFSDYLAGRAYVGNTLGSMFRNVVFSHGLPMKLAGDLRPDQEASFQGDSFRTLLHLHEGKVHFVPECDAVYRVTPEGLWQGSSAKEQRRQYCRTLMNFNEYFEGECGALLKWLKPHERLMLWLERNVWAWKR